MNCLEIHLTPIIGGLFFGLLAFLVAALFYWAKELGYREGQRRGFALGFRDGRRSEREAVETVRAFDWAAHHSRILLLQAEHTGEQTGSHGSHLCGMRGELRCQRAQHRAVVFVDNTQQHERRAVRLAVSTLPMPQRAKADAELGGEFLLRQPDALS